MHNKVYQVSYIIRYIYFIYFKDDNKIDDNWQQKYSDTNQINYSAANKLVAENFLFDNNDFKYYNYSMHYILLNILSNYFLQMLNKPKIKYQDSYYLAK